MPSEPHAAPAPGVHLTRVDGDLAAIERLADLVGGRVGLTAVLGDLNRIGSPARAPGRAVHRALTWDRADRHTTQWWPQGISTSADASDTEEIDGRRVLAVSWYAKPVEGDSEPGGQGSRITFVDLATARYRHVLLVVPELDAAGALTLTPLRVHAGGIVWWGPYLHIAATARGFMTCRLDDLLRIPDEMAGGDDTRLGIEGGAVSSYGYRYVLPVRFTHRAHAVEGQERLRYSFLSLDRAASPPELVVGEYARGQQTRRMARFPLDPDTQLLRSDDAGRTEPLALDDAAVAHIQGAAVAGGEFYLTTSHGPTTRGSVYVGRPGRFRRHRWATPMGPEDITYWPSTDLLWSISEHPGRRWVYAMKRTWFDR